MNTTRSNEFYENLIKQVFLLEATVNTLTFFIKKYNPELAKELDNPKKFEKIQELANSNYKNSLEFAEKLMKK